MNELLGILAQFVEQVAISGAGFFSWGFTYQPDIPDELLLVETKESKCDYAHEKSGQKKLQ